MEGKRPALRILLAEDSPDNVFLIQAYLKGRGCYLDLAENGETAVQKFISSRYDLVLMDVEMPVMDGCTATRQIRDWERQVGARPVPILALTAHALVEERHHVLGAGCSAHLAKPISKSTLLQAIEDYAAQPDPSSLGAPDDPAETSRPNTGLDPDVAELIPAYLQKRQSDLKALAQALDSLNYERVRILGHNLKGSGGAFGFPEITAIGKLLEQSAKDKAAERIRMQIDALADLLQRAGPVSPQSQI